MTRWQMDVGWFPQIQNADDFSRNRVPGIAAGRCLGCGKVMQFTAYWHGSWSIWAAQASTEWLQGQECLNCHYDPEEAAMPALAAGTEVSTDKSKTERDLEKLIAWTRSSEETLR